jgi:hypothetical protein
MREEIERERQRERERERGGGSEERERVRDGSGAHCARTDDSRLLQFFQSAPLSLRHVRLWLASDGFFLYKNYRSRERVGGREESIGKIVNLVMSIY